MRIIEINSYRDFLSFGERWSEILQKCDHTIFSTWEWLSIGWKYFGNGKKLLLLLAEENGETIGIAPLQYSVHNMFGLRRGKIEFIGTQYSDYNDFILAEKKVECLRLFKDYLFSLPEKWDCIDLIDIPEKAGCLPLLNRLQASLLPVHKCSCTALPKACDNYPKTYDALLRGFNSKLRRDIRRNLRRIEKDGYRVSFSDYSSNKSFCRGMDIFFKLHQKRFTSKGLSGVFAEKRARDFNLEIAKSLSQKNWLGLYVLELSNEPVSALYGFRYGTRFYFYLSGFDPLFNRYSIGNLLLVHVMARCAQDGLTEFDFMRGAEEYKLRWNSVERWNYQAVLTKKGLQSLIKHKLYSGFWSQGTRLKYFLGRWWQAKLRASK